MFAATICGNLGRDAETKSVESSRVTEFSVAVKVSLKKDAPPVWVRCSAWGDRYEKIRPYLTKGTQVMVRGAVNVRAHEGKAYTDMRVDDIELLGGRKNEET
jgi:single-strand DNA-binding protein